MIMAFNTLLSEIHETDTFIFKGLSLFKVFYNAAWERQYRNPSQQTTSQRNPRWFFKKLIAMIYTCGRILYLSLIHRTRQRVLFFGAHHRYARDGDVVFDLYNARIIDTWGREHFIVLEKLDDGIQKQYRADVHQEHLSYVLFSLSKFLKYTWGHELEDFALKILQIYPHFPFAASDIIRITAFFFAEYYFYNALLSLLRPREALLICYYGKEAFIAACKHRKLFVTELMHGIIHRAHTHYCSTSRVCQDLYTSGMLPDRIVVYGEYWKQVIAQGGIFPEHAIVVGGYYLKTPQETGLLKSTSDKRCILITTQPLVQDELRSYISFLKKSLDWTHWFVIIKPHPSEAQNVYEDLVETGKVEISTESVYTLLKGCDIHLSVCSTVLYEAVMYEVCNYSLQVLPCLQICEEIVASGVARPLQLNQAPELYEITPGDSKLYFAPYNPGVFLSQLFSL